MKTASLAFLLLALAGCQVVDRRLVLDPGENRVYQVQSGDRLYFDLEEDTAAGQRWTCRCDDDDVEVSIDHSRPKSAAKGLCGEKGEAEVRIRVHRGYDGPSTLIFACRRGNDSKTVRQFTITLYKRTGDTAVWKAFR